MKQFNNFYEGAYAKYILPGVLLQTDLIGGGYATGRESYSYGAKFGAMGWISGLTMSPSSRKCSLCGIPCTTSSLTETQIDAG